MLLAISGKYQFDLKKPHTRTHMLPSYQVLSRLKQQGATLDELRHASEQLEIAKKLVIVLNKSPHTKKLRNTFALRVFFRRVVRVSQTPAPVERSSSNSPPL